MIVRELDGYYWNSLSALLDEAYKRHRQLMARYQTMMRDSHPSTYGQGKLIDLNAHWITTLKNELDRHPGAVARRGNDGG